MTAKEMMVAVGRTGALMCENRMAVDVNILDCRKVFDRIDYLVEPVKGAGKAWVSESRVAVCYG